MLADAISAAYIIGTLLAEIVMTHDGMLTETGSKAAVQAAQRILHSLSHSAAKACVHRM